MQIKLKLAKKCKKNLFAWNGYPYRWRTCLTVRTLQCGVLLLLGKEIKIWRFKASESRPLNHLSILSQRNAILSFSYACAHLELCYAILALLQKRLSSSWIKLCWLNKKEGLTLLLWLTATFLCTLRASRSCNAIFFTDLKYVFACFSNEICIIFSTSHGHVLYCLVWVFERGREGGRRRW